MDSAVSFSLFAIFSLNLAMFSLKLAAWMKQEQDNEKKQNTFSHAQRASVTALLQLCAKS